MFAGDSTLKAHGADLWDITEPAACGIQTMGNQLLHPSTTLADCADPNHGHKAGFEAAYDLTNQTFDLACGVPATLTGPDCTPTTPANYEYIDIVNSHVIDPYIAIAHQFGFSNYSFQTNSGPSFLAHQFLFSGTSAPVGYGDSSGDWTYFAVENATKPNGSSRTSSKDAGCASDPNVTALDLNSTFVSNGYDWPPETLAYLPPYSWLANDPGYPCYNHNSLATLLDAGNVTWKYYTSTDTNNIWTAPNALSAICPPAEGKTDCSQSPTTTDWAKVDSNDMDILTDIGDCGLPKVSWVIPDGSYSDHPGLVEKNGQWVGSTGGPDWVASIVNAVGKDAGGCGYWTQGSANNVTIIITWDDWGGWFDHVTPPEGAMGGYPNSSGTAAPDGNWYTYGFRVPLLVVSPYTNTTTNNGDGYTGYISGPTDSNGNPVNEKQPYYHDFGSILGYVEYAFGLSPYPATVQNPCGIAGADPTDFPLGCDYPFADYFAPDGEYECSPSNGGCGTSWGGYPLSDFFGTTFHAFPSGGIPYATYPSGCFTPSTVSTTGCLGPSYGQDPDNDGVDLED